MKPLPEIVFGFSDAENYRRRENKNLFNKIFLQTDALEKLCGRNVFFLVGEKGTGKTAYAVYFGNSAYRGNISMHHYIRETDYQKFMALKKANNLSLSDFTNIWKVIIYLLFADAIYKRAGGTEFLLKYSKFKALRDAIDDYYDKSFSPEIPSALQFVENSKLAAEIVAKHTPISAKIKGGTDFTQRLDESRFQTNLLFLEKQFEECLASLRLSDNHILFIDGIDIRPNSVPYEEYLDCVKGLANASELKISGRTRVRTH